MRTLIRMARTADAAPLAMIGDAIGLAAMVVIGLSVMGLAAFL